MKKNDKKPLGYTCGCGKFNQADGYAAAHRFIELTHTCGCGNKNTIYAGRVIDTEIKSSSENDDKK